MWFLCFSIRKWRLKTWKIWIDIIEKALPETECIRRRERRITIIRIKIWTPRGTILGFPLCSILKFVSHRSTEARTEYVSLLFELTFKVCTFYNLSVIFFFKVCSFYNLSVIFFSSIVIRFLVEFISSPFPLSFPSLFTQFLLYSGAAQFPIFWGDISREIRK